MESKIQEGPSPGALATALSSLIPPPFPISPNIFKEREPTALALENKLTLTPQWEEAEARGKAPRGFDVSKARALCMIMHECLLGRPTIPNSPNIEGGFSYNRQISQEMSKLLPWQTILTKGAATVCDL